MRGSFGFQFQLFRRGACLRQGRAIGRLARRDDTLGRVVGSGCRNGVAPSGEDAILTVQGGLDDGQPLARRGHLRFGFLAAQTAGQALECIPASPDGALRVLLQRRDGVQTGGRAGGLCQFFQFGQVSHQAVGALQGGKCFVHRFGDHVAQRVDRRFAGLDVHLRGVLDGDHTLFQIGREFLQLLLQRCFCLLEAFQALFGLAYRGGAALALIDRAFNALKEVRLRDGGRREVQAAARCVSQHPQSIQARSALLRILGQLRPQDGGIGQFGRLWRCLAHQFGIQRQVLTLPQ